jgi:hypothetical protein
MRDDGRVSGDDLLRAAADELYAAGLDSFTERRKVLAAGARAAGEPAAAKEIAALRKPTRSAWTVNQLVRADPSVPERLSTLAGDLRAAEAGAKKRAAETAAAEAERERRQALAEAEQAAASASRAVHAATAAVQDRQAAVRRIEEQLTEARDALAEARVDARQAGNAQRRAQQTLDRLRR